MSLHSPETVRFGLQVVSYDDVSGAIEQAVRAEECGFDAVSLPDHLFHPTASERYLTQPPWEAFTVLGAISQRTESVELLPGVTDTVRRHPTELAHAVATLDRLTGGRAVLGIGAGEAFNFATVRDIDWDRPYTRFREALEVILALWGSTPTDRVTYDGEYYDLRDAHLGFEPARDPRPPVWIGGYGPKMRALTGRVADGWLPWIHAPDQYAVDLEGVLDAAREVGRDPATLTRSVMLPTNVTDDGDAAIDAIRDRAKVNLALRPPLLAALGYPELAEETPIMWRMAFDPEQQARLTRTAERIPDEAVDPILIAGTPDEAIERLEAFVEAGVDFPILFAVGDRDQTLERYRTDVIPYFKS